MIDIGRLARDIADEMRDVEERGKVATYIPPLARIDPGRFGLCIVTADGAVHTSGDSDEPFSIQSVSKVFALTQALGKVGEALWRRVGREPSGTPFNSIVQLERERGVPRNPFINAGALVVADVNLAGHEPRIAIGELLRFMRYLADDETIIIDEAVARAEQATGFRNIALVNYMKEFGNIAHSPELTLGVYFHQCAIAMTCRQLAMAGRFLMHGGFYEPGGPRVISGQRARRINALMLTCGHYDASGDFAFRVGLPGKSGVGGGILAIAPGKAAIAVWSPGLNANGNSLIGTLALERITEATGWSVFSA